MFKTTVKNTQRRMDRKNVRDVAAGGSAGSASRAEAPERIAMAVDELERQILSAPPNSAIRKTLERRKQALQSRWAPPGRRD